MILGQAPGLKVAVAGYLTVQAFTYFPKSFSIKRIRFISGSILSSGLLTDSFLEEHPIILFF